MPTILALIGRIKPLKIDIPTTNLAHYHVMFKAVNQHLELYPELTGSADRVAVMLHWYTMTHPKFPVPPYFGPAEISKYCSAADPC